MRFACFTETVARLVLDLLRSFEKEEGGQGSAQPNALRVKQFVSSEIDSMDIFVYCASMNCALQIATALRPQHVHEHKSCLAT